MSWRTIWAAALVAASTLAAGVGPATAQPLPSSRDSLQFSYAPLVKKVSPAVVNIYTATTMRVQRRMPFPFPGFPQEGGSRVQNSLGSGVLVKPDGLIVTNAHVVRGADEIRVVLSDRREFDAKLVIQDDRYDLALLRIDGAGEKFPFLELRDSDSIEVGDIVLAIGNPYGLSQTVTQGIVSATGRGQLGLATFENFIQTDAAINLGNSGGALIDAHGTLVGINTAVLNRAGGGGPEGIGFAIPVNLVRGVMQQIMAHGRVIRGSLGLDPTDLSDEQANELGLISGGGVAVARIYEDSPAFGAGLRRGDLITSLAGEQIKTAQELVSRVAALAPGTDVQVEGRRGLRAFKLRVTVIERPQSAQQAG